MAWPFAVVAIALVFRVQIRTLMTEHLSRFRAGPFEAEFDRLLSEVGGEVPATEAPPESGVTRTLVEELNDVASLSPLTAVLDGFAAVDKALRDLIAKNHPDRPIKNGSTAQMVSIALSEGLITPETARNIEGITVLRNLAAHGRAREVTEERAREYLALVDAILYTIREGAET